MYRLTNISINLQNRSQIIIVIIFLFTFCLISFLVYNHSIRECTGEKEIINKELEDTIKQKINLKQTIKQIEDTPLYQSVLVYKNEILSLKLNLTEEYEKHKNINQFLLKQNKTLYSTVVSLIRNGEFSVSHELFTQLNEFDLNAIITSVYDKNIIYTEKIMEFLNTFGNINDIFLGYRLLLNQMLINKQTNGGAITTLAYRSLIEFSENHNENLVFIRSHSPESLKTFPWNQTTLIHNEEYGENLDVASDVEGGYERIKRQIFTYSRTDTNSTDIHHQFFVIPVANGTYFYIKSKKYEEYLYLDTNDTAWDSERRPLFSWKTRNVIKPLMGKWQLESIEGTGSFKIRNVYWNEYMYIEKGFELKRFPYHRKVFTSRSGKCDHGGCKWKFVQVYN